MDLVQRVETQFPHDGLTWQRLEEVELPTRERTEVFAKILDINKLWVRVKGNFDKFPDPPYIAALSHRGNWNYFFIAHEMFRRGHLCSAWAKPKFMGNPIANGFFRRVGIIPVPHRKDTLQRMYKGPDNRSWIAKKLFPKGAMPDEDYQWLTKALDGKEKIDDKTLAEAVTSIGKYSTLQMQKVGELSLEFLENGGALYVFGEGTRGYHFGVLRNGLAELALHSKVPVIPVGVNGGDHLYAGWCPIALPGSISYNVGDPVDLSDLKLAPHSTLFCPQSQLRNKGTIETATSRIGHAIHDLHDEQYQSPLLYGNVTIFPGDERQYQHVFDRKVTIVDTNRADKGVMVTAHGIFHDDPTIRPYLAGVEAIVNASPVVKHSNVMGFSGQKFFYGLPVKKR